MNVWIKYTDVEQKASNKFSQIKSRVKKTEKNKQGYDLEEHWLRSDFIKWYVEKEKKCCYCGCTEEEIKKFYNKNFSKRKDKRGKNLEIERLLDKEYSQMNCDLVCYWCNNAKSDVFTPEQFSEIGRSIGKIIKDAIEIKS